MEKLHEDTGYGEIIFNDWGILSFSQLNSEPGERYITEIVEFSKSSGLGRDFITWGQARTIEEVDAEKESVTSNLIDIIDTIPPKGKT